MYTQLCSVELCCLFLLVSSAFAQNGGSITGTVFNLAGEPVAKAEIQATNTGTKTVYNATTSTAGMYSFSQLPAGPTI
jgi:hypothetical protein